MSALRSGMGGMFCGEITRGRGEICFEDGGVRLGGWGGGNVGGQGRLCPECVGFFAMKIENDLARMCFYPVDGAFLSSQTAFNCVDAGFLRSDGRFVLNKCAFCCFDARF